jgi:hypothetical protein
LCVQWSSALHRQRHQQIKEEAALWERALNARTLCDHDADLGCSLNNFYFVFWPLRRRVTPNSLSLFN